MVSSYTLVGIIVGVVGLVAIIATVFWIGIPRIPSAPSTMLPNASGASDVYAKDVDVDLEKGMSEESLPPSNAPTYVAPPVRKAKDPRDPRVHWSRTNIAGPSQANRINGGGDRVVPPNRDMYLSSAWSVSEPEREPRFPPLAPRAPSSRPGLPSHPSRSRFT